MFLLIETKLHQFSKLVLIVNTIFIQKYGLNSKNLIPCWGQWTHCFLSTLVFWWTKKPHVYCWTQKIIKGSSNDMRFWSYNGPNRSIKRHEILKGENLDLGPSKDMRFLGPSKVMRWWKMGKIWSGPSKDMSAGLCSIEQ